MRGIDVLPWVIAERACVTVTAMVYIFKKKGVGKNEGSSFCSCLIISVEETMIHYTEVEHWVSHMLVLH